MQELTHNQLKDLLTEKFGNSKNGTGVTFISLKTITKQNVLNKGGRSGIPAMVESIQIDPEEVKKHSEITGLVSGGNVSYEDFVNNRLTKEAKEAGKDKAQLKFEAGERKWGTYDENCKLVVNHKGESYLVVYCLSHNKPKVSYTFEGQSIDVKDSKFDQWRKPSRNEGQNQGTETPIVVRDYKFSSIKEITLFGETYKVVSD